MEGKLGTDRSEAMMWVRHDKVVTGSIDRGSIWCQRMNKDKKAKWWELESLVFTRVYSWFSKLSFFSLTIEERNEILKYNKMDF